MAVSDTSPRRLFQPGRSKEDGKLVRPRLRGDMVLGSKVVLLVSIRALFLSKEPGMKLHPGTRARLMGGH